MEIRARRYRTTFCSYRKKPWSDLGNIWYTWDLVSLHCWQDLQDAKEQVNEIHIQADRCQDIILGRVTVENHVCIYWERKELFYASSLPDHFFQCLTKDDVAGEDENTSKCDSELHAFGEWEENLHKANKDKYPKRCEKTGGVDAISTYELKL